MIEIRNLSKSFGDKRVLDNVNIKIDDGHVFGLVGINGAGKSTLLRIISGVYQADTGGVLVDGKNIYDNEKMKREFFFLPDEPYYSINTTPKSLTGLYKTFYDFDEEKYYANLEKFKIDPNKKMHNFSKGMKRQVFVSLAIATKPKYLLLDEAFDGLDPLARLEFKREIIDLVADHDVTVIISSHSLRELQDICDSFGLIDNCRIDACGDIDDEISKYHKYQVAFAEDYNEDDFKIKFKSFVKEGKIIKFVCPYTKEELLEQMGDKKPILIDEIKIDFEELFIIEVESRGYLK